MRKILLATAALSMVVGIGCKHVGGKCDCYHDPSNAELPAGVGGQPYHTASPAYHGPAVPEKLAAPVEKAK